MISSFQSRFCSNLQLPNHVQKGATHIARKAVELDLVPGYISLDLSACIQATFYLVLQHDLLNETPRLLLNSEVLNSHS